MNRVSLVGRITKDPELKISSSNVAFVQFSLAIDRFGSGQNGERDTDFINCVTFGKSAENMARFIKKGRLLGVEGRLQSNRYQAQDGTNRTVINVVCDSVYFLESKTSGYNNNRNNFDQNWNGNNQNNYNQNNYQNAKPSNPSFNNMNSQQQNSNANYGNNNNYQRNNQETNVGQQKNSFPQNNQRNNSSMDVQKDFDITDDDLPF